MVERQLPKLDTRVRFPSPAFIGEKYSIKNSPTTHQFPTRAKEKPVRQNLEDVGGQERGD